MSWTGDDATDRMPTPQPPLEYHTHHHVHNRTDLVWFTAMFLMVAFAAGITAAATFALADTVNRALSMPVCREVK